jgi:hypothetical protein
MQSPAHMVEIQGCKRHQIVSSNFIMLAPSTQSNKDKPTQNLNDKHKVGNVMVQDIQEESHDEKLAFTLDDFDSIRMTTTNCDAANRKTEDWKFNNDGESKYVSLEISGKLYLRLQKGDERYTNSESDLTFIRVLDRQFYERIRLYPHDAELSGEIRKNLYPDDFSCWELTHFVRS